MVFSSSSEIASEVGFVNQKSCWKSVGGGGRVQLADKVGFDATPDAAGGEVGHGGYCSALNMPAQACTNGIAPP